MPRLGTATRTTLAQLGAAACRALRTIGALLRTENNVRHCQLTYSKEDSAVYLPLAVLNFIFSIVNTSYLMSTSLDPFPRITLPQSEQALPFSSAFIQKSMGYRCLVLDTGSCRRHMDIWEDDFNTSNPCGRRAYGKSLNDNLQIS